MKIKAMTEDNLKTESEAATRREAAVVKRLVIFRSKQGELEFKVGLNSLFLFWPRFMMTNVDIGLMVKTGFMIKTYNKWSRDKFISVAILIFGFGFGVSHSCEAT